MSLMTKLTLKPSPWLTLTMLNLTLTNSQNA